MLTRVANLATDLGGFDTTAQTLIAERGLGDAQQCSRLLLGVGDAIISDRQLRQAFGDNCLARRLKAEAA